MQGLLRKAPPTDQARRYLLPLDGGPWLVDTAPRIVGRKVALVGLALTFVGTIGGATTMQPWCATLFFVSGMFAFAGGGAQWVSQCWPPSCQLCPQCLTSMRVGATTCPACRYGRPLR